MAVERYCPSCLTRIRARGARRGCDVCREFERALDAKHAAWIKGLRVGEQVLCRDNAGMVVVGTVLKDGRVDMQGGAARIPTARDRLQPVSAAGARLLNAAAREERAATELREIRHTLVDDLESQDSAYELLLEILEQLQQVVE